MFFGGADDEDENDFTPSTGSKLASLFGGSSSKSANLKYVAPKQPTGEKTNSVSSANQPQGQSQTPSVLLATAVHAYLYIGDQAQSQGRAMCCLLGSVAEKNFQLLVYRSKQDHLTRAKIHQHFTLMVMPNNYASFTDDQQRTWSIMIDTGQYANFVMQVGICRALTVLPGNGGHHLLQDVIIGEGPPLKEGDNAQISYSSWNIDNGKKEEQAVDSKSSHRVKLREGGSGWEMQLIGAQKNGRRLVFLPNAKDITKVVFYDVSMERIKQKGGGDQSGRSTPQVDLQHHHRDFSSSERSLDMLPEDTVGNIDGEGMPPSKPNLAARMARMGGQALLPSDIRNSRHPPTDSESEVEEISRKQKHKYTSGSVSGSVEELSATPAIRSRAPSTHSDTAKPDPAPRPSHLTTQPQQVVVYQSPWQQPAIMPPGYSAIQPGVPHIAGGAPQPVVPAPDPTISLLFSETRSQNTELKISVSKMSDKIDGMSLKIEKLDQQLQLQGACNSSAMGPANVMVPQTSFNPASNSFDTQAILSQITSLVHDNDSMKTRLEDKEKKIHELNESVTQLLQKNQKLLEDKTEMLIAKQESGTSVSLSEVLALREEKASIVAQLGVAQNQLTLAKDEALELKKRIEKQEDEMKILSSQVKEEQTKSVEFEKMCEAERKKEAELDETLTVSRKEMEQLKALLSTCDTERKESKDGYSNLLDKNKALQNQLETTESECNSLKEKLKLTLQQMEERTRGDGESSIEKEIENQLREEITTKTAQLTQLEQKLADLQIQYSEVKEELSQQSTNYQAQIQRLEAEKSVLENSSNHVRSVPTDPDEVVNTVKKVMNSVFRMLKPQFSDEESYSGSVVMQTLLSVIRDTTLQLLEDVEKKKSLDEGNSQESETTSDSQEKRGNGVPEIGSLQKNEVRDMSTNISCVVDSSAEHLVKDHCEVRCQTVINKALEGNEGENVEMVLEAGEGEYRQNVLQSDCDIKEVDDLENQTEISSSEGEYTDASDRQFSPESSVSSSDSSSYDCEKSANTVCIDSGTEKEVSSPSAQEFSEKDKAPSPHAGEDSRAPVIDMENTEVPRLPVEKSDSSRDSSLERAWKPQPPPPPLFSDEEEDDDWLS